MKHCSSDRVLATSTYVKVFVTFLYGLFIVGCTTKTHDGAVTEKHLGENFKDVAMHSAEITTSAAIPYGFSGPLAESPIEDIAVNVRDRQFYVIDGDGRIVTVGLLDQFVLSPEIEEQFADVGLRAGMHRQEIAEVTNEPVDILWSGRTFSGRPSYHDVWEAESGQALISIEGQRYVVTFNLFECATDIRIRR